jgi:hypothetical protein
MKKLLLLGAILVVGSMAYAVSDGVAVNGFIPLDENELYAPSFTVNQDSGDAGGIGSIKDVTTRDNAVHNDGGVNIFRDRGPGWEDMAATGILLNVLEPIRIESEVDFMYTEAVTGDELQIGDIGFRVDGMGPAEVEFKFIGHLFDAVPGEAKVKGHNGFYPMLSATTGLAGVESVSQGVMLQGSPEEIEVDLYLDLTTTEPGLYGGAIIAKAEYR